MEDLSLTSKLFLASSKLNQASSWLQKLAKGTKPDAEGIETLKWAGHFLGEVDVSSKPYGSSAGGNLSIQATSVRPTFYSSVMRIAPLFQKAGFNNGDEIIGFLNRLNGLLLMESAPTAKSQKPDPAHYRLAGELLREVSRSIMVQLSNNGLPRHGTLGEEGEPSGSRLRAAAYT